MAGQNERKKENSNTIEKKSKTEKLSTGNEERRVEHVRKGEDSGNPGDKNFHKKEMKINCAHTKGK
jgi:hypothetical protein